MAADDDPSLRLFFPGHRVAADDPFAALIVFLDGENKILHDGDIAVDADIHGAQFTNGDLGRFGPEAHPFIQPRTVDIDGALVPEAEEFGMDIL